MQPKQHIYFDLKMYFWGSWAQQVPTSSEAADQPSASQAGAGLLTLWHAGIAAALQKTCHWRRRRGKACLSSLQMPFMLLWVSDIPFPSAAPWERKRSFESSCSPIVWHLSLWGRAIQLQHLSSSGKTRRRHGTREALWDLLLGLISSWDCGY